MAQRILASLAIFLVTYYALALLVGNVFVRALVAGGAVWYAQKTLFRYRGRRRAMSAPSAVMALGGFPEECKLPDPIINVFLYFDRLPSLASLQGLARAHLFRYERFRSIPVPGEGDSVVWQPVRTNPVDHFIEHEASDLAGVESAAQTVVDSPLAHPHQPQWEFHLIRNTSAFAHPDSDDTKQPASAAAAAGSSSPSSPALPPPGPAAGRSLLVFRCHHSIGDGISLVAVFNQFLTDPAGRPLGETQREFARKASDRLAGLPLVGSFFTSLLKVLTLPSSPFDAPTAFNRSTGKLLRYSGVRRVVKVPPVSLEVVKQLKNKAGVTVNDVVYAATAGAVRRLCEAQQDPAFKPGVAAGARMRTLLPLAFPRSVADPAHALRNQWTFVSAPFPVHAATAKGRLEEASAALTALKRSLEAPVSLGVSAVVEALAPLSFVQQTVGDLFSRHSLVFSNVPGPDTAVMLDGCVVREIQMVYPNLLTQVGLLSYCGTVFANFTIDTQAVKGAESLGAYFHAELRELCRSYSVQWVEPTFV